MKDYQDEAIQRSAEQGWLKSFMRLTKAGGGTVRAAEVRLRGHHKNIAEAIGPIDAAINFRREEDDSDDDEGFDAGDADNVFAWISSISGKWCSLEKVREILKKLEDSIVEESVVETLAEETSNDVSDVHSPPCAAARAAHHGLRQGFSLDFICTTFDGEPWNCCKPHLRQRAIKEFDGSQPEMLTLSPICVPFSQLHGPNYSKVSPEEVQERFHEGVTHLKFSMTLCKLQAGRGKLFMFERPAAAKPWMIQVVRGVLKFPGVMFIVFADLVAKAIDIKTVNGNEQILRLPNHARIGGGTRI